MEQESALRKLRQEMEEPLHRAEREREELQAELRSLQHDRDQSLLQAETEKQQVRSEPLERYKCSKCSVPACSESAAPSLQALSLKETEKAVLSDRVSNLQAELAAAALEAERMSREAALYKEQEQVMPVTCVVQTYLPGFAFYFYFWGFNADQSRSPEQRAAGPSLSAGGCLFPSRTGAPECQRGLYRPAVSH